MTFELGEAIFSIQMSDIIKKVNHQGPNQFFEKRLWRAGVVHICGVDEVGRGPLAGPVMACAAIFDRTFFHPEIQDSKLLSVRKREVLGKILTAEALEWNIGLATAQEIDLLNIRQATFLAMRRAINSLSIRPDYALIDGENLPDGICLSSGIIKGDQKSFTIAAASIIAKVSRDRLMVRIGKEFPAYRFHKNKGYGTREHIEAIINHGPCPYHRKTFLTKLSGRIR